MSKFDGHPTYAVIGASFLWPWNVIITAAPFVAQRLQGHDLLVALYSSSVMTVSTVVSLAVSTYLALRPAFYASRITKGELLIGIAFAVLAGSCLLGLSAPLWFIGVLAMVALSSVGTSMVQNGAIAITQRIPGGSHARSLLIGQSVAGVVPPLLAIAGGVQNGVSTQAAAVIFLSASVLATISLYIYRGPLVFEHSNQAESDSEVLPPRHTLVAVAKELAAPAQAIIVGFAITLCYPVFANGVRSQVIAPTLFSPLTHLIWNIGDLLGRSVTQYDRFQIHSGSLLVKYAWSRLVFVVLLSLIAVYHNPSDVIYWLVQFFFGVTSGHLLSAAISYAPSCVSQELRPAAGGLIVVFIGLGLTAGSLLSFAVVPFVK